MKKLIYKVNKYGIQEVGSKTSVISGCGMLIRGVVKFSARNCPGINFRKVGNYGILIILILCTSCSNI